MPKEHKKRGRREETKRKREEESDGSPLKRHRSEEVEDTTHDINFIVDGGAGSDFISFHETQDPAEPVFYGLLDQEEQDYYASVNTKLELNDFEDGEDRAAFIDAVHRESNGKELKIACSQSCSRYLERLILVSTPQQLRALFVKFSTHFLHLVQHRFASHCCEALFIRSAYAMNEPPTASINHEDDTADETTTFEKLVLDAVTELSDNLGYLLTERFASHAVRILIVVLSGEPLDQVSMTAVLSSRKKEKIDVGLTKQHPTSDGSYTRTVPVSFTEALAKFIGSATSSLNTTYLRALATHPTGNPVLQLFLKLELSGTANLNAKQEGSIFKRLFPDDSIEEGSDSAKFIQGLLYDPSGSRLLETIIQYASGKTFKKLYRSLWKERMGIIAKNDIASYVAICIIQRLSHDDLADVLQQILPEIPGLVERYRVAVIKALIERCQVREVELQPLLEILESSYGRDGSSRLPRMLKLDVAPDRESNPTDGISTSTSRTVDLHGSLLAQTMLQDPTMCSFIQEALLNTSSALLVLLSKDQTASRIIQAALKSSTSPASFRRQFVPILTTNVVELATDISGSHVIDALWDGTADLHFMKERIARELQEHESEMRESRYGRVVWRNWSMDIFERRKLEWQALAKGIQPGLEGVDKVTPKSGIELARAKFAAKQARGNRQGPRPSTISASA